MFMVITEEEKNRILSLYNLIKEEDSKECSVDTITKDNFWEKVEKCNINLSEPHLSWKGQAYDYLKKFWELTNTSEEEIRKIFEDVKQYYISYYSKPETFNKIYSKIDRKTPKRREKVTRKFINSIIYNLKEMKMLIQWDFINYRGFEAAIALYYDKYGDIAIFMPTLYAKLEPKYDLKDTISHEVGHAISDMVRDFDLEDDENISQVVPKKESGSVFDLYVTSPSEVAANYRALRSYFGIEPNDGAEQVFNKIKNTFDNGKLKPEEGYTIEFEYPKIKFIRPEGSDIKLRFFDSNNQYVTSTELITKTTDSVGDQFVFDTTKLSQLEDLLVKNGQSDVSNIA